MKHNDSKTISFKKLNNPELIALISIIPRYEKEIKEHLKQKEISVSDFTTGLCLGNYRETMVATIFSLIKDSKTTLRIIDKIPKNETVALLIAVRRLKEIRNGER